MKTKSVIALALLASLGALGYAGENSSGILDKLLGTEHAKPMTRDQWKLALTVKDYLGLDVVGAQGERLGKVADFTLKDESGKFDRVVLAVGGTLGLGEVLIAVPYEEIRHKPGTRNLVWNVARSEFQAMVDRAKAEARAKSESKVQRNASAADTEKGAARLKETEAPSTAAAAATGAPETEKAKAPSESNSKSN